MALFFGGFLPDYLSSVRRFTYINKNLKSISNSRVIGYLTPAPEVDMVIGPPVSQDLLDLYEQMDQHWEERGGEPAPMLPQDLDRLMVYNHVADMLLSWRHLQFSERIEKFRIRGHESAGGGKLWTEFVRLVKWYENIIGEGEKVFMDDGEWLVPESRSADSDMPDS